MTTFEDAEPALAAALDKRGYATLTPVQQAVLAPELGDADLLVSAQTGSGKTVAFGLAIAPSMLQGEDRLARSGPPLALAIAPTRELALQVKRELEWLYELTGAVVASCVGGMDMRAERRALDRGAHIVVGTPGRLRDHIERGSFDTSGLRAVVLDEADEMLDLGFRDDLEYILDTSPEDRRTLMFSATVPRAIGMLAKNYQRDAVRISTAAEQKQHLDIEYRALNVAPNDKENAIINLLRYFEPKNALVFCGTRATVSHMTSRFNNRGFSVVALSGELSQNERTHALQAMRDGRARVCIATDVAARGIDLPDLELVIHADLPNNRESLLHRSGRTGRAGRKGVSALIVPYNARRRTERLLQGAGIRAEWGNPPSVFEIMQRDDERILADPALTAPIQEEERDFVQTILTRHGPEQVAAALVRLYRADRTAPEELLEAAATPAKSKQQCDNFRDSVWISLSVGRKESAEPRWLLPLLCRAGHLTKRDIGAIRIQHDETYVELASDSVERFHAALGASLMLEKSIRVKRLDAAPDTSSAPRVEPRAKANPKRGYASEAGEVPMEDRSQSKSKTKNPNKRKLAATEGKKMRKPASAAVKRKSRKKFD
jgi:ATP-dependent RNA helicase DeaD